LRSAESKQFFKKTGPRAVAASVERKQGGERESTGDSRLRARKIVLRHLVA
jgi:hypothetical protein